MPRNAGNAAVGETGCSNDNLIEETSRKNSHSKNAQKVAQTNSNSALKANNSNNRSSQKQTTTINVEI